MAGGASGGKVYQIISAVPTLCANPPYSLNVVSGGNAFVSPCASIFVCGQCSLWLCLLSSSPTPAKKWVIDPHTGTRPSRLSIAGMREQEHGYGSHLDRLLRAGSASPAQRGSPPKTQHGAGWAVVTPSFQQYGCLTGPQASCRGELMEYCQVHDVISDATVVLDNRAVQMWHTTCKGATRPAAVMRRVPVTLPRLNALASRNYTDIAL